MEKELKEILWKHFEKLGQDAITMSHYDLAVAVPNTTRNEWRDFLNEPDVTEFTKKEMRIISDTIQKQMITGIADGGDKSVGRAQIINTLEKLSDNTSTKFGPAFIYTYVPPDTEQVQAENVQILTRDIFKRNRE